MLVLRYFTTDYISVYIKPLLVMLLGSRRAHLQIFYQWVEFQLV